jgi:hypothetical protein
VEVRALAQRRVAKLPRRVVRMWYCPIPCQSTDCNGWASGIRELPNGAELADRVVLRRGESVILRIRGTEFVLPSDSGNRRTGS